VAYTVPRVEYDNGQEGMYIAGPGMAQAVMTNIWLAKCSSKGGPAEILIGWHSFYKILGPPPPPRAIHVDYNTVSYILARA
jgi:hypothetical protein